jgi:hypothetical protein
MRAARRVMRFVIGDFDERRALSVEHGLNSRGMLIG